MSVLTLSNFSVHFISSRFSIVVGCSDVRRRDGRGTRGSADPDPGLHDDQADLHRGEDQGQGGVSGGEDLADSDLPPLHLDDIRLDRADRLLPLRHLLLLLHAPGHLQTPGPPRVPAVQLYNREVSFKSIHLKSYLLFLARSVQCSLRGIKWRR